MQQPSKTATATHGSVVWFDESKGYGFIRPDGVEVNDERGYVFVHYSNIVPLPNKRRRNLTPDQRVEFSVLEGPKGLYAHEVKPIASD